MRYARFLLPLLLLAAACGGGGGGGGPSDTFPASPAVDPFTSAADILAPALGFARIHTADGVPLDVATNQVLATLADGYSDTDLEGLKAWVDDRGGRIVGQIPDFHLVQIELPGNADVEAALQELPALPGVYLAAPNLLVALLRAPIPDPRTTGHGWWIDAIDAPAAWDVTTGSPQVALGLVDAGYDPESGHFLPNRVSFVDPPGGGDFDQEGHGTAVASLLAADGADGACAVGMAWESHVYVADVYIASRGAVLVTDVLRGLHATIAAGSRAVNVSLGPVLPDGVPGTAENFYGLRREWRAAMMPAVRFAATRDALLVWSAGNTGRGTDIYHQPGESDYVEGTTLYADDLLLPPTLPGVEEKTAQWEENCLIVGSVGEDLTASAFSTGGAVVDISAPGENIMLGGPAGQCSFGTGTSFSAPLVTGTAALLAAVAPGLPAPRIREILIATARTTPAWDATVSGAGILEARDAVLAAGE